MTILEQLAEHARERVAKAKENISLEKIKSLAYALPKGNFVFEKSLGKKELSFICECKKASPSNCHCETSPQTGCGNLLLMMGIPTPV